MHEKHIAHPVIEPENDLTALETLPGIGSGPTAAPGPPIPVLGVDNVLFSVGDLDVALEHYSGAIGLPVAFSAIPTHQSRCSGSAMRRRGCFCVRTACSR